MPKVIPETPNRAERVIAYMMIAVIGLSIASFLAIIFGTLGGLSGADFGGGIWPIVLVLPYVGLPFAVLLLITLVILNARRRVRDAKAQPRPPQKK